MSASPASVILPRGTDAWLWVAVIALVPLGVVMVHSAALAADAAQTSVTREAMRQGAYGAAGLVAMFVAARLDYRWLQRGAVAIYATTLLALAAVLVIGVAEHGAQRWLGVGGFTV